LTNSTAESGGAHTHTDTIATASIANHSHSAGSYYTDAAGSHAHSLLGPATSYMSRDFLESGGGSLQIWKPTEVSTIATSHSNPYITDTSANHQHNVLGASGQSGGHSHVMTGSINSGGAHTHSVSGGTWENSGGSYTLTGGTYTTTLSSTETETRPENVPVNFFIKIN